MKYVGDEFSLKMLGNGIRPLVIIEGLEQKPSLEGCASIITDEALAAALGLSSNADNFIRLQPGDELLAAYYDHMPGRDILSGIPEHDLRWYRIIIR